MSTFGGFILYFMVRTRFIPRPLPFLFPFFDVEAGIVTFNIF